MHLTTIIYIYILFCVWTCLNMGCLPRFASITAMLLVADPFHNTLTSGQLIHDPRNNIYKGIKYSKIPNLEYTDIEWYSKVQTSRVVKVSAFGAYDLGAIIMSHSGRLARETTPRYYVFPPFVTHCYILCSRSIGYLDLAHIFIDILDTTFNPTCFK